MKTTNSYGLIYTGPHTPGEPHQWLTMIGNSFGSDEHGWVKQRYDFRVCNYDTRPEPKSWWYAWSDYDDVLSKLSDEMGNVWKAAWRS